MLHGRLLAGIKEWPRPLLLKRLPLADKAGLVDVEGPNLSTVICEGGLTGLHPPGDQVKGSTDHSLHGLLLYTAFLQEHYPFHCRV